MSLKSFIKKAGKTIGKAKNVLLPVAGAVVGLALPGVGGAIGNILNKGKDALSKVKAKAKETPGFLGIGDKLPGVLGIGTGKGALKRLQSLDNEELEAIKVKLKTGEPLTVPEQLALQQSNKSEGLPTWLKLAGGAGALYLLARK